MSTPEKQDKKPELTRLSSDPELKRAGPPLTPSSSRRMSALQFNAMAKDFGELKLKRRGFFPSPPARARPVHCALACVCPLPCVRASPCARSPVCAGAFLCVRTPAMPCGL